MMTNTCAMNERLLRFVCSISSTGDWGEEERKREREGKQQLGRQIVSVCMCVAVSVYLCVWKRERETASAKFCFNFLNAFHFVFFSYFSIIFISFSFRALVRIGTFLFCFMSIPVTVSSWCTYLWIHPPTLNPD